MLVQRFYAGNDYRLVVLDNEVISAYQRTPLFVVGDGKANVRQLLKRKQKQFLNFGRDTEIDIDDFRIRLKLHRRRLTLESVLPVGEKMDLLDNANLSTGGDALDVTAEVHPDFRRLATNIIRDMGLRMSGVDIITDDIRAPLDRYVLIEINSAPGLDNYASIGVRQRKRVDELYLRVLQALDAS